MEKIDKERLAQMLDMSLEELEKNNSRVDECNATYYWNNSRGGLSFLVEDNGNYLGAASSVSKEKLIEEFKKGRRNGTLNNESFTEFSNLNFLEIKELVKNKIALLSDKINGIINANEKENSGFLLWNCKMILRNIYMACDKLLRNFKDNLTDIEISNYDKISNILKDYEPKETSMEIIEEVTNLIKNI